MFSKLSRLSKIPYIIGHSLSWMNTRTLVHVTYIFIWTVSLEDSFWHRQKSTWNSSISRLTGAFDSFLTLVRLVLKYVIWRQHYVACCCKRHLIYAAKCCVMQQGHQTCAACRARRRYKCYVEILRKCSTVSNKRQRKKTWIVNCPTNINEPQTLPAALQGELSKFPKLHL